MTQRWCFRSDDDGHYYLIPLELAKKFSSDMNKAYETDDFGIVDWVDEYRCSYHTSCYSFTNPELIK
jgi:hypothetical protein